MSEGRPQSENGAAWKSFLATAFDFILYVEIFAVLGAACGMPFFVILTGFVSIDPGQGWSSLATTIVVLLYSLVLFPITFFFATQMAWPAALAAGAVLGAGRIVMGRLPASLCLVIGCLVGLSLHYFELLPFATAEGKQLPVRPQRSGWQQAAEALVWAVASGAAAVMTNWVAEGILASPRRWANRVRRAR